MKPMGVLLTLGIVLALSFCLVLALWGIARCLRRRARKTAITLGILVAAIAMFNTWAVCVVAPKGVRTIAQLELPDGHAFVVRHYRYGWLEYPKVRFYARGPEGVWTSFGLIAEWVVPNATSLIMDVQKQQVDMPGVGAYLIQDNDFVLLDGSRGVMRQLPSGIEPGEEELD